MTTIIFIRHLETLKDSKTNASNWTLSEEGLKKAQELSFDDYYSDVTKIFTSEEIKTIQTIEPLAKKLNLPINQIKDLEEVRRSDIFLTNEEFEIEKFKQLEDLNYPAFGGETGNQALDRFESALNKILEENKDKKVIVVTHGTILNMYFAKLLNKGSDIIHRWQNTEFGARGTVRDGKVISDFVKIHIIYPNITKFVNNLNLKISCTDKRKILIEFDDTANKEILAVEDELLSLSEKLYKSTNENKKEIKLRLNDCYNQSFYNKQKYLPTLKPLVYALNEFYENRSVKYIHRIFLHSDNLYNISISPNKFLLSREKDNQIFLDHIYNELKDFDNFLHSKI